MIEDATEKRARPDRPDLAVHPDQIPLSDGFSTYRASAKSFYHFVGTWYSGRAASGSTPPPIIHTEGEDGERAGAGVRIFLTRDLKPHRVGDGRDGAPRLGRHYAASEG